MIPCGLSLVLNHLLILAELLLLPRMLFLLLLLLLLQMKIFRMMPFSGYYHPGTQQE
jgi:hypothetical protein